MITARFIEKGSNFSFEVTGHANFAERGSDIVCASVSALTTAVVNELVENGASAEIEEFVKVSFDVSTITNKLVRWHIYCLHKMLEANLQQIEQQYPENIKVVVESEI